MMFLVRPSKIFLFERLSRLLKNSRGEVGLDAGSANFKNRWMFRTSRYYGLDKNLDFLKGGVEKYDDDKTFGIYADMTRLDGLPESSVDVVVSTNTIHQLDLEARKLALVQLCRLTAPTGHFFCETRLDRNFSQLLEIIKSRFQETRIIYYCNSISRFYEWIFERDRYLYSVARQRPVRLFAWFLSRFEYLTCFWRVGNRHALIIGSQKLTSRRAQAFNLSSFPLKESRINDMILSSTH